MIYDMMLFMRQRLQFTFFKSKINIHGLVFIQILALIKNSPSMKSFIYAQFLAKNYLDKNKKTVKPLAVEEMICRTTYSVAKLIAVA
jgi:hypothetical protein